MPDKQEETGIKGELFSTGEAFPCALDQVPGHGLGKRKHKESHAKSPRAQDAQKRRREKRSKKAKVRRREGK